MDREPRPTPARLCVGLALVWSVGALGLAGQDSVGLEQLAARATPAVVLMDVQTAADRRQGSGFLVDPTGRILTNHHVIRNARSARVRLPSGDVYEEVRILAEDVRRDLAVLQISGFDLPWLELGNSDSVQVGSSVVLIGSPLGLENTDGVAVETAGAGAAGDVAAGAGPADGAAPAAPMANAVNRAFSYSGGNFAGFRRETRTVLEPGLQRQARSTYRLIESIGPVEPRIELYREVETTRRTEPFGTVLTLHRERSRVVVSAEGLTPISSTGESSWWNGIDWVTARHDLRVGGEPRRGLEVNVARGLDNETVVVRADRPRVVLQRVSGDGSETEEVTHLEIFGGKARGSSGGTDVALLDLPRSSLRWARDACARSQLSPTQEVPCRPSHEPLSRH